MLCGKKKLDERKKQSECQLDRGFKKKKVSYRISKESSTKNFCKKYSI